MTFFRKRVASKLCIWITWLEFVCCINARKDRRLIPRPDKSDPPNLISCFRNGRSYFRSFSESFFRFRKLAISTSLEGLLSWTVLTEKREATFTAEINWSSVILKVTNETVNTVFLKELKLIRASQRRWSYLSRFCLCWFFKLQTWKRVFLDWAHSNSSFVAGGLANKLAENFGNWNLYFTKMTALGAAFRNYYFVVGSRQKLTP